MIGNSKTMLLLFYLSLHLNIAQATESTGNCSQLCQELLQFERWKALRQGTPTNITASAGLKTFPSHDETLFSFVALKNAEDTSKEQWVSLKDGIDYSLEPQEFKIESGDSIAKLLEKQNIRADDNSIGLVWAINPSLENVDELYTGSSVYLPIVTTKSFQDKSSPGYKYALYPNYETRRNLKLTIGKYNTIQYQLVGSAINSIFLKLNHSKLQNYINKLNALQQDPKTPNFITTNINHNALALFSTLDSSKVVPTEAQKNLDYVAKTLQEIAEGQTSAFIFEVHTKFDDDSEAKNYQIYYAPLGLVKNKNFHRRFSNLSTPTSEIILYGDWYVWAVKGNQKSEFVKVTRDQLNVGSTKEISISLEQPTL